MSTSSETNGSAGPSGRPEPIDLLIRAGHVVTMNPRRDIIRHGAVAVSGGEIVAVGKEAELRARYEAASEAGGDHFVATPGMVNSPPRPVVLFSVSFALGTISISIPFGLR